MYLLGLATKLLSTMSTDGTPSEEITDLLDHMSSAQEMSNIEDMGDIPSFDELELGEQKRTDLPGHRIR